MNFFDNKRTLKWSVIGLLILNIGLLTFIFIGHGGKHPPHRLLHEQLQFDKQQINTFHSLRERHFKKRDSISKNIRAIKTEWYDKELIQPLDSVVALAYATKLSKEQIIFELELFHHFQSITNICTPEQRKLWQSFVKDFATNTKKRNHKRRK